MGLHGDFGQFSPAVKTTPELGRKLEYFLGNATSNAHNIERSTGMLRQLESIGLHDNPATRQYLTEHWSVPLKSWTGNKLDFKRYGK